MLDQGAELSKILAETHPAEAIALAIYGDFLVMKEQFEEAKKQYLLSKEIDDKNFTVWQQLFICFEQTGDYDGLHKVAEEAMTMFPDQSLVYLYKGIALTRLKKHEQAIKVLIPGSKMVVDHDRQLIEFYKLLGDNYNDTKEYSESDKYFEKALKLNPKDAYLLNNYSYYLSERGENLEKAETMSRLANELRPDEPSFLDTYGWILYKLGKYEDALTWLQKALEHGGNNNGTILEHTGDVFFKTGNTEKAIEYWNKAKATGETSVFIDQKIRDKKLYE
jgi:tetratricopeptide (TPR) repeat protein